MVFSLVTQEAIWLRLLFTKLKLLTLNKQFTKIHINENNKSIEVILSFDSNLYQNAYPNKTRFAFLVKTHLPFT